MMDEPAIVEPFPPHPKLGTREASERLIEGPQTVEAEAPMIVRAMAPLTRDQRYETLASLSSAELSALMTDWRAWARPKQLAPPGDWFIWLVMAGRGFGKTETGARWLNEKAMTCTTGRLTLVGPTAGDVRDTMVEGPSGILATARPDFQPKYFPGKKRIVWPNGAIARLFSGEKPGRMRGPQYEYAWIDELPASQYPSETFSQLELGLRLGQKPQALITTTPKPIPVIRELVKGDATKNVAAATPCPLLRTAANPFALGQMRVVLTHGSSLENRANLAQRWYEQVIDRIIGTTLGQQEVFAQLLEEVAGALWTIKLIEAHRWAMRAKLSDMVRIVVAVDPAVTSAKASNETGIVVCGEDERGHGYLLADLSGRYTPLQWAKKAVEAYEYYKADRIIAEDNNGGELVEQNIANVSPDAAVKRVHASRGKFARAEPIAALAEKGQIHHVGTFAELESQLTTWTPDGGLPSPDRLDAYVWGFSYLLIGGGRGFVA